MSDVDSRMESAKAEVSRAASRLVDCVVWGSRERQMISFLFRVEEKIQRKPFALFADTGTADFPLLYFPIYSASSEYGN
jgi:hypothetical protein